MLSNPSLLSSPNSGAPAIRTQNPKPLGILVGGLNLVLFLAAVGCATEPYTQPAGPEDDVEIEYEWKESEEGSAHILRNWIFASTGLFVANASIGAIYVISWDMEEGFFELLSLVHLMLASLTFLEMATAWIGCVIATEEIS